MYSWQREEPSIPHYSGNEADKYGRWENVRCQFCNDIPYNVYVISSGALSVLALTEQIVVCYLKYFISVFPSICNHSIKDDVIFRDAIKTRDCWLRHTYDISTILRFTKTKKWRQKSPGSMNWDYWKKSAQGIRQWATKADSSKHGEVHSTSFIFFYKLHTLCLSTGRRPVPSPSGKE